MDAPFHFTSNFGTVDWIIVAVYLCGTVALGVFANRYIKDMADYMVAGRSLKSSIAVATMLGVGDRSGHGYVHVSKGRGRRVRRLSYGFGCRVDVLVNRVDRIDRGAAADEPAS